MANQVEIASEGYVQSVTQITQFSVNQIVAGTTQLLARGSTEGFGVCCDPSGMIFVSDPTRHCIMKIWPSGTVYLYAGLPGTSGNNGANVVSLYNARFNTPRSICCDRTGNLYVADSGNNQIRKITPDGYVSLIAGNAAGVAGYVNGTASRFNNPWGLCVDRSGNIMVADTGNHAIRKITTGKQFGYPNGYWRIPEFLKSEETAKVKDGN